MRLISFTEISKALTCPAQWDFSYGGHLAGSSLKRKAVAPRLQAGRAWGAGMAAWHAHAGELLALGDGFEAIDASLERDAERQREFGFHDPHEQTQLATRLYGMLSHQTLLTEPFLVVRLEEEIIVALPSRTGVRSSNRYGFVGYFDGTTEAYRPDELWLVEYKLRDSLTDYELVANSRQVRWYAWAWQRKFGQPVHGVLVEERLSEAPKPARLVQARRKGEGIDGKVPSHAHDQLTTPELYVEACQHYDVEPHEDTVLALGERRWFARHPVQLRQEEIQNAGEELVAAARRIHNLDSGVELPIRNVKPQNCRGCFAREICPAPDSQLVDELFERTVPKRERAPLEEQEPVVA